MEYYVLSDYVGERLALLKAERERGGADPGDGASAPASNTSNAGVVGSAALPHPGVSEEERVLRSGREGEQIVVHRLRQQLSDQSALLNGYQTWNGEIDLVVITPRGIAAVEVKSLNADVAVDGDTWSRRRRGHLDAVIGAWSPITDAGGRSPSLQLNEAADHLQRLLNRSGLKVKVQRWVVLAHPQSRLHEAKNLTVDGVVLVKDLEVSSMFEPGNVSLIETVDVESVRALISRDHVSFERRRASRPAADIRGGVPPVQGWPQSERMERLVDLARRATKSGETSADQHGLRTVVRHDLLVRREPFEVPALISKLRGESALELVLRLAEETSQIFEEPDRCLVALCIPVGVRLRKFLNFDYTCESAKANVLASIELLLRSAYRMRRVVIDPRLYGSDALLGVGPQDIRRYLLDLESRGLRADPAGETTSLVASRHGGWDLITLLGVAVVDPTDVEDARAWSRLPLPPSGAWQPAGAFDGFDPKRLAPGVMHEAASVGVCALGEGLRMGPELLRRLRTGIQNAEPEAVFMAPLRLSL